MPNYLGRREVLFNETIPTLNNMGIPTEVFDAIPYQSLNYNTDLTNKVTNTDQVLFFNNRVYTVDGKTNEYPLGSNMALCIGHQSIWEECVENNMNYLILEDDVIIQNLYENQKIIKQSILSFLSITEPSILYLQATSPAQERPKYKLKKYPDSKLSKYNDVLYQVSNTSRDWAGTAAYMINPAGAKKFIERSNSNGITAPDAFIDRSIRDNVIRVFIPQNYDKSFLLHPELG
jgi:GR25 family glycosyltransferase involved in LPS biosynthesis